MSSTVPILPLFHYEGVKSSKEELPGKGCYHTIQRLVTTCPNNPLQLEFDGPPGEVETSLEEYRKPEGDCLWRRIIVRSGPGRRNGYVHASFILPGSSRADENESKEPISEAAGNSNFCWAAFPDRPHHKLLCVLSNPSLLSVWDVYPSKDNSTDVTASGDIGEGHSVSLPFEASGIYPLGDHHGLLLQRRGTVDDDRFFEATNDTSMCNGRMGEPGSLVPVLKDPPKPLRMGVLPASDPLNASDFPPASPSVHGVPIPAIPSVFSLSHALDEVLPVSRDRGSSTIMSDVYEKLIYVGTSRWLDFDPNHYERQEHSLPIAVTYNTRLRRHAVWALRSSIPPPPELPLWQICRRERTSSDKQHSVVDQSNFVNDGNLDLLVVSGEEKSKSNAIVFPRSRNEALADALGVKPLEHVNDCVGGVGRSARQRQRRSGRPSAPHSASLLTPPSTTRDTQDSQTDGSKESRITYQNVSKLNSQSSQDIWGKERFSSPFGDLYPKNSMTLLYEDQENHSPASKVFLTSNADGCGALVLCLVHPTKTELNPLLLRCFSIEVEKPNADGGVHVFGPRSIDNGNMAIELSLLASVPCQSAVPIQSFPAHQFLPSRVGDFLVSKLHMPRATDILVITKRRSQSDAQVESVLSICRGSTRIAECHLQFDRRGSDGNQSYRPHILGLEASAGDKMDIIYENCDGERGVVRGKLSLSLASFVAEKLLKSIEWALFHTSLQKQSSGTTTPLALEVELSLKIRTDCFKVLEATEYDAFTAVLSVVSTVLDNAIRFGHENQQQRSCGPTKAEIINFPSDRSAGFWSQLLRSPFHRNYSLNEGSFLLGFQELSKQLSSQSSANDENTIDTASLLSIELLRLNNTSCFKVVRCLFDTLHLFYEDLKLSKVSGTASWLHSVGCLLVRACANIHAIASTGEVSNMINGPMSDFMSHYLRDLGAESVAEASKVAEFCKSISCRDPSGLRGTITSFLSPPCFLTWLMSAIRDSFSAQSNRTSYCSLSSAMSNPGFTATRSLKLIFELLFSRENTEVSQKRRYLMVVQEMAQHGITTFSDLRDRLPLGMAIPLLETLYRCRMDKLAFSSRETSAWSLVGRDDLVENYRSESRDKSLNYGSSKASGLANTSIIQRCDKENDGLSSLELNCALRFPKDNRIREAVRLLRSSRPTYLKVNRAVEVSDHDFERLKQEKLSILSRRVLALPLGRGMLTMGSLLPLPAEPLPIPDLCMSGRVPPTNAFVALDTSHLPVDMKVWPEFHNGVAAGLRIPEPNKALGTATGQVKRTWILYNKPNHRRSQPNSTETNNSLDETNSDHAHAGVLLALGLRGHLSVLSMTDIYDYLTGGTATTTVGLLLGLAADRRGMCDPSISRILCLHIPSLLPSSFSAIDVAGVAQAAAVAGIGLLYQGSSHRLMTEFLLNEMGRPPVSDMNTCDREAYTLSCGIALGMINLGRGDLISGKVKQNGTGIGLSDLRLDERLYRYIIGSAGGKEFRRRAEAAEKVSSASMEFDRFSSTVDSGSINTTITAPGAILALGLTYLQTGNATVASNLSIPDTLFLMEYVRPDLLLLRVVARSLVLWDNVEPTSRWIEEQVPTVVRGVYNHMRSAVDEPVTANENLRSSSIGAEMPSSLRDEEDIGDEKDCKVKASNEAQKPNFPDVDRHAVRQIYAHVIAGACLSVGLRFAGTRNTSAASAISNTVMKFLAIRDDPTLFALKPEQPILEMCIGCAVISLSMVMAGTGDLQTLRIVKILRWKCDEVNYGNHMAYAAAIGLLFLGGGNCTVGRSPEDIAALVLSFFPRFPATTSDNQYHLQALRHFYALAVKQRILSAVDIDSRKELRVPIKVIEDEKWNNSELVTPCLLHNGMRKPKELHVESGSYYPLVLEFHTVDARRDLSLKIYVKRRSKVRIGPQHNPSRPPLAGSSEISQTSARVHDRTSAFICYFCGGHRDRFAIDRFSVERLFECAADSKEEALPLYLTLRDVVGSQSSISDLQRKNRYVREMQLIRTYYESPSLQINERDGMCLLNGEFVSAICAQIEGKLM